MTSDETFSDRLEAWLEGDGEKTVYGLGEVFAEKSFAVTILFLMFFPALPLPTGGITHVFEIITIIIAAEMVVGAKRLLDPSPPATARPSRRRHRQGDPFHDEADSLVRAIFEASMGIARSQHVVSQISRPCLHHLRSGGRRCPSFLRPRHAALPGSRRRCAGHDSARTFSWSSSAC